MCVCMCGDDEDEEGGGGVLIPLLGQRGGERGSLGLTGSDRVGGEVHGFW